MKILHLADIHARNNDIEEIQECLVFIHQAILDERPDIVVIAGDIFNSRSLQLDSEAARLVFTMIAAYARETPVAIVTGTPYHEGNATMALSNLDNVWVSNRPEQFHLSDGEIYYPPEITTPPEAIISMVPTPTKQWWSGEGGIAQTDADIAEALTGLFAGFGAQASQYECPHIMVGHFSVRGAQISEKQYMVGKDIEIGKDQLSLANADVICLGHIHKMQHIQPNIYYSGSIYSVDQGETDPKGFYRHDVDTTRFPLLDSTFIETPARKRITLRLDYTNEDGYPELSGPLTEDADGAYIKIVADVWQDEADSIDFEPLTELLNENGAEKVDIQINRKPRENVRSERILKLDSLRDKVEERAKLADDDLPDGVLDKCDLLEGSTVDEIIEDVTRGT